MLCSFQEGQVKYIVASSGFLLSDFSAGDQSAPPLGKTHGGRWLASDGCGHVVSLSTSLGRVGWPQWQLKSGKKCVEMGDLTSASTRSFRGYFPEVVHCRCKGSSCCHETTIGIQISCFITDVTQL